MAVCSQLETSKYFIFVYVEYFIHSEGLPSEYALKGYLHEHSQAHSKLFFLKEATNSAGLLIYVSLAMLSLYNDALINSSALSVRHLQIHIARL